MEQDNKEKNSVASVALVMEYIRKYEPSDMIYPESIRRQLKIPVKDIYEALETLRQKGYIEQLYRVYCPYCQHYLNQIFHVLNEMPTEIYCEDCDYEITDPLEKTYLIYRMKVRM